MKYVLTQESYSKIDDYWVKCWDELREVNPGKYTRLKGKLNLTDDELHLPDKYPSTKKVMILPDLVSSLQRSKDNQKRKKDSPL